jgi:hypothetical protein
MISTSASRASAAWIASNTTAPGSAPCWCAITSTPASSPHCLIWSIAAARNVSAAASTTLCPACL